MKFHVQPAEDDGIDPGLGESYYKGNKEVEARCTKELIESIGKAIGQRFSQGERPARRDAHAFDTGCVRATFQVDRELAPELRHGAFQPGHIYQAWIRYSNANFVRTSPRALDARGMAIKLMGVPGDKLISDEKFTQDYILISHPRFFVNDLVNYKATLERYLKGGFINQWVVAPLHLRSIRLIWIALLANLSLPKNPLLRQYWSMTAYQLGIDKRKIAVKYTVKPRVVYTRPKLRKLLDIFGWGYSPKLAMHNLLAGNEVWFDFYVQRFVNDASTPVEDSTVEWLEKDSKLCHVAKIVIPSQPVMSKDRDQFCENLSFSPWHSLREHRPLGLVNRVRKSAYLSISAYRHSLNRVEPSEPQDEEARGPPA